MEAAGQGAASSSTDVADDEVEMYGARTAAQRNAEGFAAAMDLDEESA